jgi:O-antigen/teichoic acid export membrane protein
MCNAHAILQIEMTIARRSVTSSAYNLSANAIQIVINFARSILLARLLFPDVFGLYAFVSSIVTLSQTLPNFGLMGAFLYHTEHDRDTSIKVYFTLSLIFNTIWAAALCLGAAIFATGETRTAFFVVTLAVFLSQLTQTPRVILTRQVTFRRLALTETVVVVIDSSVAVGMAWAGYGLWSLLAANFVGSLVAITMLYGFRPVWRPGFSLSKPIVRDFLNYGRRAVTGSILLQTLDQLDDIWTQVVLGETALGFYDRAYGFATYPRKVLSKPINDVAMGTYSQLKGDRKRLSQAFFRVNAFMVRTNFLFSGLLALIAPEFIRIVLGSRWLPMLGAFRLMLIYTLLDPIKLLISNLINVSGAPEKVTHSRFIQLLVMIPGLGLLAPRFGISGVALAVDLMLVVGVANLYYLVRAYVDFSLYRLFGPPALALATGMLLARLAITLPGVMGSDWRTAAVKIAVCVLIYGGILVLLEKKNLPMIFKILRHLLPSYE